MRSVSRRRPAEFVRPAVCEARIGRMWSAISKTERAQSAHDWAPAAGPTPWTRRGRVASVLVAAALAAALVIGVWRRPPPGAAMTGLLIDTGAATQEVSLTEGSTLHLAAATRLRVISRRPRARSACVSSTGAVICDVVHQDDRRFVVEAGGIEVEDRGTRFAVDVSPEAEQDVVVVHVERGTVEVHDAAHAVLATLKPGSGMEELRLRAAPRRSARRPPRPSPRWWRPPRPLRRSRRWRSSRPPPRSRPGSAPAPKAPSAQALFARADAARLAGHHAEAAADFERFRRRFPNDPRAGLAAYELGRIRLGSLHDPRGAAEAFGAVAARPDEGLFREDAEAGRVEALADLGDDEGCKRARDAFRARYPRSPQAGRVAKLCGR